MNINYKSDFVIKVSFSEKLTAFKLLFRTSGQKGYTAELKDDGTTTNCKVSDKDVYVVFKDHFLGVGQLAMELVSWRTDVNFDGVPLKNVVPSTETIYLINGLSDGVTEAEVSTAINYAVISSYTMAKANGYSGTEADYNVYLATLPQVVGTASDNNTAYENAEGIRKSNENARTANEETRVNAESLRNGNESVRISNENSRILHEDERRDNEDERKESEGKRVIAETSRVNAEQSRVAEFSTLKQASETATTNAETAAQNVKDGNTPILRVGASGNWEVSYDNGATYTDSGTKAQGDKGDKGDSGAAAAVVQDTSSLDTMTSPGVYQLNFVSSELINYKALLLVTSKNGVSLTQWVLGNFAPDGQTSLILSSDNRISMRSGDVVNGNYVWDAWSVYNDASNKVDKMAGKGLSSNDYSSEDKSKLGSLVGIKALTLNAISDLDVQDANGVYNVIFSGIASENRGCFLFVSVDHKIVTQHMLCDWGLTASSAIDIATTSVPHFYVRRGTIDSYGNLTFGLWKESGAENLISQTLTTDTNKAPSCKAVTDAKELLFRDMWNSACGADGTYNAATGYYELNGITDLTYSQAVDIMNYGFISWLPNGASTGNQPLANRIRTMFPPQNNRIFAGGVPLSMLGNFQYMAGIEVVKFQAGTEATIIVSNGAYMFYMCEKLKQIIGIFNLGNAPTMSSSFYLCNALVGVKLLNLKTNINLKYSPLLSYDSVKYMVDNAANTTAIVITVHATTLSYLNGTASSYTSTGHTKEEWQAIVTSATTKNITFAS